MRRIQDETGAAITELAIMLPILLMLLVYGIYFTDLLQVRLKSLELSRFATWETTVYRTQAQIDGDAKARFRNLRSYDKVEGEPNFLLGVEGLEIVTADAHTANPVQMMGASPDFAFADGLGKVLSFVGNAQDWVLEQARLPIDGKVLTTATIRVNNRIVPLRFGNQEARADRFDAPFEFTDRSALVYETFRLVHKPNNRIGFTNPADNDPMNTYEGSEDLMQAQLAELVFMKSIFNGFVSGLTGGSKLTDAMDAVENFIKEVASEMNVPWVTDAGHSRNNHGPITMRPAETTEGVENFSPSYARNDSTRYGDRYSDSMLLGDSIWPNVDRSRYSLPHKFNTDHWNQNGPTTPSLTGCAGTSSAEGGQHHLPLPARMKNNEYARSNACRGHYYEGMLVPAGKLGDSSSWGSDCGDLLDDGLADLDALLGDLSGMGFELPF